MLFDLINFTYSFDNFDVFHFQVICSTAVPSLIITVLFLGKLPELSLKK